jgi:hypothetical protein
MAILQWAAREALGTHSPGLAQKILLRRLRLFLLWSATGLAAVRTRLILRSDMG